MDRYDTIIIGLGAMGSAAAAHLARRGKRVLGIEQFDLGHARGSSHGATRMIRMCYYEHPDYVPLLRRAYELWREAESASGRDLLHITGGIYAGPPDSEAVNGAARAAAAHKLDHTLLSRDDLARRFPWLRVPPDHSALYEPMAGYVLPEAAIAAHQRLALDAGAEFHDNEHFQMFAADGDTVTVTTSRGGYSARNLIFACGAWATRVVTDLGIDVRATRQILGWVQPCLNKQPDRDGGRSRQSRETHNGSGRGVVWAIDCPRPHQGAKPGLYYGFPTDAGGVPGFKLARHAIGPATDPDTNDFTPRPEDEADFRPALRAFLPDADGPLLSMRVCMYENSPDGHFIIDRHPRMPNVIVACGFSGHGFKFMPVIGEVLADLAIDGATRHPIGFLGLSRFSREP